MANDTDQRTIRAGCVGKMPVFRILFSAIVLLLFTAAAVRAAENVPGSSCSGYTANSWQWAGGPENGGVSNGMFCNGGTTLWTGIINFQSTGYVGIGTASPTNLLTLGAGGWNSTPRQAIQILDSGYDVPSADGTQSNCDKLVLWNETNQNPNGGLKAAIGLEPFGMFLQPAFP
jgi:hypothetical protein